VTEELFFRGILYGYFRRWGIFPALFLSTLFFVLLHPVKALAVTQTVGGVLFAAAYEIEGNLLVPITIHVLGNLAIFSLPFLVWIIDFWDYLIRKSRMKKIDFKLFFY
jgi:membrane protease YdiL (CAAX protease family)